MKRQAILTLKRLPDGSIIDGKVVEHGYQIERITGAVIAYGQFKNRPYRAGDRITEKEADDLMLNPMNGVVTLKPDA